MHEKELLIKFKYLVENTYDVIWQTDPDLRMIYVSPNIKRFLGYTSVEYLRLPQKKRVSAASYELIKNDAACFLEKIKAGKHSKRNSKINEIEYIHKKGHVVYGEVHYGALYKNNQLIGFAGITRDISKRKQRDWEIKRLSAAIYQSPSAILLTDLSGTINFVNPAFCQITGYSRQELIGKNPRLLKSGHTSQKEYQKIWKTIVSGKKWTGQFRNLRKDKSSYWERAVISPIRDQQRQIIGFIGIKEDITRQKIAEKAVERQNELNQADALLGHEIMLPEISIANISELLLSRSLKLFSCSMGAVATYNEHGSLINMFFAAEDKQGNIFFNEESNVDKIHYCQLKDFFLNNGSCYHGYYKNNLVNLTDDQFIVFPDSIQNYLYVPGIFKQKMLAQMILLNQRNEFNDQDLAAADNLMLKFTIAHFRRMLEVELINRNQSLATLNQSKDKLFSILSHDLRSPLGTLHKAIEMYAGKEKQWPDEKRNLFLSEILKASGNIYHLTENLFQWARSQQDSLMVQPQYFNLSELLAVNLELGKTLAAEKIINVSGHFIANAVVYADNNMIDTVVRNLIANAVKFTRPEGTIEVFLEMKDEVAEVAIRDTGIGVFEIPVENIANLRTLEVKAGTKGEKGIGLGLTICSEFIVKNHGHLWLEYSNSQGSEFRFSLPLKPL